MRHASTFVGVIGTALLVAAVGTAAPARASGVGCGDVITADTLLQGDVGPCSDGGLVAGADHITLDLNGHAVFGTDESGDGVGIRIAGRVGVTVTNGTMTRFDAGVYLEGGGSNEVSHLNVRDNISSSIGGRNRGILSFGDGIVLNSDHNVIRRNAVVHNGPNAGIGVYANSAGNMVRNNVVTDNDVFAGDANVDDGIRLESGAHETVIVGNRVERNGRTGIAVFAYGSGNVVRSNVVRGNGFSQGGASAGPRGGNGIRVYEGAAGTVVRDNDVFANRANGIRVDSRSSVITGNRTGANGGGGRAFDLHDTNRHPRCDGNIWSANTFDTAFPDCVKGLPAA